MTEDLRSKVEQAARAIATTSDDVSVRPGAPFHVGVVRCGELALEIEADPRGGGVFVLVASWPGGHQPQGYYVDPSGRLVRVHLADVAACLDDEGRQAADKALKFLRSWPRRDLTAGDWQQLGQLLRQVWPAIQRTPAEKLFQNRAVVR